MEAHEQVRRYPFGLWGDVIGTEREFMKYVIHSL